MDIWLIFSILAALMWAITNILDKISVERLAVSPFILLMIDIFISTVIGIILLIIFEDICIPLTVDCFFAILSGFFTSIFTYFYYKSIKGLDVSVVAAILQLVPLFSVMIGIALIGEKVKVEHLAGAGLILFGTLLTALDGKLNKIYTLVNHEMFHQHSELFILIMVTLIMATSNALQEVAVRSITPLEIFIFSRLGMIPILIPFLLNKKLNYNEIISINLANEQIRKYWPIVAQAFTNILGAYLMIKAYEFGPLSLVSPLSSTQVIFAVILTLVINHFWEDAIPDEGTRKNALKRLSAGPFIVIGVFMISK